MSWRSIAVYYCAAAILGGYLWVTHQTGEGAGLETEGEQLAAPIVDTLASRIDHLVIRGEGMEMLLVRGEGARWRIDKPDGLKVTADLIDALLDTLTTIPPIELLAVQGDDLEAFGLAPAEISMELSSAGRVVAELGLGRRNPTRTAVYAVRQGARGVYLLGLNARYYLELVFDELARQDRGGGG